MATDCIPQLSFKFDKLVVAKFDAEHASCDGGAVLLKALDRQWGVTDTVARCLRDRRQPGKVQHVNGRPRRATQGRPYGARVAT